MLCRSAPAKLLVQIQAACVGPIGLGTRIRFHPKCRILPHLLPCLAYPQHHPLPSSPQSNSTSLCPPFTLPTPRTNLPRLALPGSEAGTRRLAHVCAPVSLTPNTFYGAWTFVGQHKGLFLAYRVCRCNSTESIHSAFMVCDSQGNSTM